MDLLTIAYSASGLVLGGAYVPQLMTLLKDRSGAVSLNLSTWLIFTVCSVISLLYSCEHSSDGYFIFCNVVGFLGNVSILSLGAARRISRLVLQPVTQ